MLCKRCSTGFRVEYLTKYGLRADSRDASFGAVSSPSCRFCLRYGREAQPELLAAGKRGPISSVKQFGKPWRTVAFLQPLRKQHGEKWKEYDDSDVAAREKFFELSPDAVAYVNTLDAHLDNGESPFFWLRRNIVNRVIGDLLFDQTESDEEIEVALSIFEEDGAGEARVGRSEHSELKVTVRKVLAFSLVIDYVGAGLSFRQENQLHRGPHRLVKLKGIPENEVVKFVRAVVGMWKGKLIGIATDGARNMTGRHSSAVTRLASGAFPGFYRIWCGAHQPDLVIQEVMSGHLGEAFYGTLKSCISHLRRQQNLVSSLKTTCPSGVDKVGFSSSRMQLVR
jgi:hypothetical protein